MGSRHFDRHRSLEADIAGGTPDPWRPSLRVIRVRKDRILCQRDKQQFAEVFPIRNNKSIPENRS